jgi:hypothetical protein
MLPFRLPECFQPLKKALPALASEDAAQQRGAVAVEYRVWPLELLSQIGHRRSSLWLAQMRLRKCGSLMSLSCSRGMPI